PAPHLCTLSLHDALPISLRLLDDPDPGRAPAHCDRVSVRDAGAVVAALAGPGRVVRRAAAGLLGADDAGARDRHGADRRAGRTRSEEHTSELQSRENLVC